MRAASEFAARNHLPPRIQDQMLSHTCLKFKTEGLKQQETFNSLPKAIRSSITHHLFFPVVSRVYLFKDVSHNILFQLVIHPRSYFCLKLKLYHDHKKLELLKAYSWCNRYLKWRLNISHQKKMLFCKMRPQQIST